MSIQHIDVHTYTVSKVTLLAHIPIPSFCSSPILMYAHICYQACCDVIILILLLHDLCRLKWPHSDPGSVKEVKRTFAHWSSHQVSGTWSPPTLYASSVIDQAKLRNSSVSSSLTSKLENHCSALKIGSWYIKELNIVDYLAKTCNLGIEYTVTTKHLPVSVRWPLWYTYSNTPENISIEAF